MNRPTSRRAQLALNLHLRDASSFENFLQGTNREVVELVRALSTNESQPPSRWLYLWGESGTGKTHLLEAACLRRQQQGRRACYYLSMQDRSALAPELLDDLGTDALVCLDDVEQLAGDRPWEQSLLGMYERLRTDGGTLIVAARTNPASLAFSLQDLATRLSAGLVYQLHPLTDTEKVIALRERAGRRGVEMSEEVAEYLLSRYPRDLHSLFHLLDRLDSATLAAQRRLTIPFLRSLE